MIKSVSVSIPAYNDEATISGVIRDVVSVVSVLTNDLEVIVINDGSRDNTAEEIRKAAGVEKNIRIYEHKENMGFGVTLKEAFTFPSKEWIFLFPGDAQFLIEDLPRMLEKAGEYDYILGVRKTRSDNLKRRLTSFVYNLMISAASGKRVRDVNSIVLFRKDILSRVVLKSSSAFVHAELYCKAVKNNFKTTEVEVGHRKRMHGRGGGGKFNVILKVYCDLLKFIFAVL